MKYFCTESERKGTCYHEFQKGKWNEVIFWKEDSLLIHDDIHYELNMRKLFLSVIPSYDIYGETEVDEQQWDEICKEAATTGGELNDAIMEADAWVRNVFKTEKVFTMLGI